MADDKCQYCGRLVASESLISHEDQMHPHEWLVRRRADPYVSIDDMEEMWADSGLVHWLVLGVGDHIWLEADGQEYELRQALEGVSIVSTATGELSPPLIYKTRPEEPHRIDIPKADISKVVYGGQPVGTPTAMHPIRGELPSPPPQPIESQISARPSRHEPSNPRTGTDRIAALDIDTTRCAICGALHQDPEFAASYVTLVCGECESRAVNAQGETPFHSSAELVEEDGKQVLHLGGDFGDNPVFIDGHKCWRRYKFGGYVTMRDVWGTSNIGDFYDCMSRHRADS